MLTSIAPYGDRYHTTLDGSLPLTMTRASRRGPWLPEEDQALLQLVRTQGANNWVRISQQLQHRSPKQCRERYHQNLKPSLKHDPISVQEGEVIERLVQEMGKRWAEIARRLGNRSDNAVKNWWNGSVNRRRRNPAHATTGFKQVGSRLQPVAFTLPHEHKYSVHSRAPFETDQGGDVHSYDTRGGFSASDHNAAAQTLSSDNVCNSSTREASPTRIQFDPVYTTAAQQAPLERPTTSISRPTLPKVYTSDLRTELPPIRSSSFHLPLNERRVSSIDHGPISPALSDTSQRHVPSLVSDNQSMYSISPRTVSTPRPGVPAPVEIRATFWPDGQAALRHTNQATHARPPYHTDFYAREPERCSYEPVHQRHSDSKATDDRSKDSRMNVSTLLQ